MNYQQIPLEDFILDHNETKDGLKLSTVYHGEVYEGYPYKPDNLILGGNLKTDQHLFIKNCLESKPNYSISLNVMNTKLFGFIHFEKTLVLNCEYKEGDMHFIYSIELNKHE